MKDELGLQKLLKILFIIILVCIIFALIFKGITTITRKHKAPKKEAEQAEKKAEKKETEEAQIIENVTYNDLEGRIKLAAERYENDNYQGKLESTETYILKYDMLKEKGYIEKKLIDTNSGEECAGYVIFKKMEAKISYTPYIKCGNNYQTVGYDASN